MRFLKNCWYVAALESEVSTQQPIARTVIDEPLVLYRAPHGDTVVFEDRCCHRWAPLSRGRIEDGNVRCMYHGFKYDIHGNCIEIPGQAKIPAGARVRSYPSVERYGWVWVWMGDPAKADTALLPQAANADGYGTMYEGSGDGSGEYIDYEANYELISDNLTDFAHLSFVHSSSFGASVEWAQTRPTITSLERGIRVQRWIVDDTITPRYLPEYANTPLRNWTSYDYLAPGVLLLNIEVHGPTGMDEVGGGEPKSEPLHAMFHWQAVTPITATTSRYYYSSGVRRSENRSAIVPILKGMLRAAFQEDRQMIEAQQKVWDRTPTRRQIGSSGDVGLNRMRGVMQRLIEAEENENVAA